MLRLVGLTIAPTATGAQSLKLISVDFRLCASAAAGAELREEDIVTWRTNP
jgi:hypothetical protein